MKNTNSIQAANDNAVTLATGETIEHADWRVHRFHLSLRVTNLVGAGKRGKRCAEMSLYSHRGEMTDAVVSEVLTAVLAGASVEQVASLMESLSEPHEMDFNRFELRGIDVQPSSFKAVRLQTALIRIEADFDSFAVENVADVDNGSTCISRSKRAVVQFHRWATAQDAAALRSMSFSEVVRAMMNEGIAFHQYCAID